MSVNRKYLFAVALLAILAVAFGLAGTVMPMTQSTPPQQLSYSEDSVTHSMNPPTFDSGWVNITDKCGQYFDVTHDLNTTEVFVDYTGKMANLTEEDRHQFWSMGDVNRDGYIDTTDYDLLIAAWGTSDPDADLNEDGIVDILDYYIWESNNGLDIWTYFHAGTHQRYLGLTCYTPGWSRTYGGANTDGAYSVVQTSDGGYALTGFTGSFGAGNADFWLIKTDPSGTMEWSQTYGGREGDIAESVVQTSDEGYAIAGGTWSFGAGNADFWLIKTNSTGHMEWSQTYGGTEDDAANSVVQTFDGGYALAGLTWSFGAGSDDSWLIKTGATGNIQWSTTYGGAEWDGANSVVQTSDGGYALAGYTHSLGAGNGDFWLIKTNSTGHMEWSQTYGGTEDDAANSVVQTFDGGYALAGLTWSFGAGNADFWLVKTDSSGNMEWNKTYGGIDSDIAASVVQTSSGGYALAGRTMSYGAGGADLWLVKTDPSGTMEWSQTYGGTAFDYAWSLVQTFDGGYALAGGKGGDFCLVKTGVENGLAWTSLTTYTITLYRGKTDPYWNFVRVRIWSIKEPTWQYGDITGPEGVPDGVVDGYDLTLACGNYGKTYDDG